MKLIFCLLACALSIAPATVHANTQLSILNPIGKGETRPFRAVDSAVCNDASRCELSFGKAPRNSIVIVETITCISERPIDPLGNFAVMNGAAGPLAFVAPSANPALKVLTSAYLPVRGDERITIMLGGKSETTGVCAIGGRVLPEG